MKKHILIMMIASAGFAFAQTPPPSGTPGTGEQGTQPQPPKVAVNSPAWSQKVEAAAKDPSQIKALMAGLSPEQHSDFASAVIKAIEALPQDPDLVVANRVAAAAKELIGSVSGQNRVEVVAVIFAVTEVAYLPAVAENLAPSFSKTANSLDDAGYQAVAKDVIGAVAEKTTTTDNGTARLAIVVSIFQSGGNLTQQQTQTLVFQACPTVQESTRETVVTVANQIASTGSYTGVANLTGATLSITPTTQRQIDQRQQAMQTQQQTQQSTTQTQQQGQQQQGQTTEQQTQQQSQTTEQQGRQQGQTTTTTPSESNNIGAPGLNNPINTPGSNTEGLLGAISNRGTDPIGNVVSGGTGGTTGNPDQGGGSQGGMATGGGDIAPPPSPPPPPPPIPYQGQTLT